MSPGEGEGRSMRSDLITMTAKELDHLEDLLQLKSGQATQAQMARRLKISVRQIKRHPGNRKRDPTLSTGHDAGSRLVR